MRASPDAARESITIELTEVAPDNGTRFDGAAAIIGCGLKREDQIVVQMKRLTAFRRNWMHIDADQNSFGVIEYGSRLFDHFTTRDLCDCGIFALDMSARQEPTREAAMMNEQHPFAVGTQDDSRARDVAGRECVSR
jgi:hypothetical protein